MHILASPGYAPGTIAVNVTWMERGFNAGNATFSYLIAFNASVGVIHLDDLRDFRWVSCRMARL